MTTYAEIKEMLLRLWGSLLEYLVAADSNNFLEHLDEENSTR